MWTQIRDPIHGTIDLDDTEKVIVDHPLFQRLRLVKQLGFGDQAFPGATHTRYAHSLGAAHVAARVFDAIFSSEASVRPDAAARKRFRRALRLAVLLHDVGHPPLSHASERGLPARSALGLERWLPPDALVGRADHEDFTLKIVLDSDLSRNLDRLLATDDLSSEAIAFLITGRPAHAGGAFHHGGLDYGPILRQVVSSELDADRMDYLVRDSFYSGVAYGRYDMDWLVQNLLAREENGAIYLGLSSRAIFAFEDFLLSRYHMFVSVYYHYKSVCYDHMLDDFFIESPGEYAVPTDPEAFALHDDVKLWSALRDSKNKWAQMLVQRRPYKLLVELNPMDARLDRAALRNRLAAAGIPAFDAESRGELSKYFGTSTGAAPIYVVPAFGPHRRIEDYTPLYERYGEELLLYRAYCHPDHFTAAREVLASLGV
jgi:hypothetical protein